MEPFPKYKKVFLDCEYHGRDGDTVTPVCLVWHEWETEEYHRLWFGDEDEAVQNLYLEPPFDISPETIVFSVSYVCPESFLLNDRFSSKLETRA